MFIFLRRKKSSWIVGMLLFFATVLNYQSASATHISGADITYRWISGNSFEITVTLYRDCNGIAAPTNLSISYRSVSCGYNLTATLNPLPGTGQEIIRTCSTATTTCTGGSNPGIQQYEYRGIVTLPAQCTDWAFGYSICCRNCAITTLNFANNCNNVPGMYVEATLNNVAAPTNSSPTFTNVPVTFVCIGQPFSYNQGSTDANGDSIVYSWIIPRDQNGVNVTYKNPFSVNNPLSSSPGITLNTVNGNVNMTPTATEVAVMAILVREYRNGVLIGTVIRDMQIWTQPCTNILPTASGINGSNNFSLVACPGQPISFTINSADPNSTQNVTMIWNNGIPGSNLNISTGTRPTGTFTWTPTAGNARPQPYTFTVTVADNNCPIIGFQTFSYSILVPPLTATTSAIASSCASPGTGSASVNASGTAPLTYSWSPGGSTSTFINNLLPGFYTVTVRDQYGCTKTSTAVVNGPSPMTAAISGSSNIICAGQNNGSASVNVNGGTAPYNYSWLPSGGNAASASNLPAGNYTITVTDFRGCTQSASVSITTPPLLTAISSRTNINCNGVDNGTASVVANGGIAPYTYSWTPGSYTTASLNNLSPASYTVTVTDASGCTQTSTISITQPPLLSSSVNITPATCGSANGSASISASGGAGAYTYLWTPGNNTGTSLTNISGGAYTVVVTDANGCTNTHAVGISNSGGPTVNVLSTVNVTCFAGSNGSSGINASGSGPFTYQWSPSGGSGISASNLSAGSYIVTVRDVNNCISSVPINITEPPELNIQNAVTNVSCNGQNSGGASVAVSGGTSPYSYAWNNGNSTASPANLTAGNYSVVITDARGCTSASTMTITQPTALAAFATTTNISCFNGNNGSASATFSGGTVPYSYAWSSGLGSSSFISGIAAGSYTLNVTDANSCTYTLPVNIQQPAQLNSAINAVTNVSCNGGFNGSATAGINGGTAPFSYSWSPSGGNALTAGSLTAGSYSVLVSDANGCTASTSITITEPQVLSGNVVGPVNVSCFGGTNGSGGVNVTGGTAPYTYTWSPNVSAGSSATNLSAGNYSVLIRDANGCTQSTLISINQPQPVVPVILNSTPIACNAGNNGSAEADVTGGIGPYTYSWSPSSGTGLIANNLTAGNYSVTTTDVNGCTASVSVVITQPPVVVVNAITVSSTCGRANGAATATASGGTAGYFFSWSNSTGGNQLSNVSAGSYTVTVTDANGCITSSPIPISDIQGPLATIPASTNVSCYNNANGSATANPTGGTSPFSYIWSPSGGNASMVTNLIAGTYVVTITDANTCTSTASISISQPTLLSSAISAATNILCNNGSNGASTVLPTGGTAPYTYVWSPSGGTASTANNLTAGIYSVTVTDNNGCTATSIDTLSQPTPLALTTSTTPGTCNNANGLAGVNVTGGTVPYTYSWPSGATGATTNNLAAGIYTVNITDANGCTSSVTVSVGNLGLFNLNLATTTPVSCFGGADGTASVQTTGGANPFIYNWSPSGGNAASAVGLSATNYQVTVTDGNNCVQTVSIPVTQPNLLVPATNILSNVRCFNGTNGSVAVNVNGGVGSYIYAWSPSGGNTSTASNLSTGTYTVTVMDANSCTATASATITQPAVLTSAISATAHILCNNGTNGSATVQPTGGTAPYSYTWSPAGGTNATATNLSVGAYSVIITDANGCTSTAAVTLTQPTALATTTSTTPGTCNNANGSAAVIVSGGTAPYTYNWPAGSSSAAITNLAAGNYTVNISDANNCTASATVSVGNLGLFNLNTGATTPVSCFGRSDGSASVQTSGGISPFTYSWSPSGGSAPSAIGLSATNYQVTVTDGNNCVRTVSIPISQPTLLTAATNLLSNARCFNSSNGSASINVNGGTGPYTYSWNPGGWTTTTVTSLSNGSYAVLVTDNNGCTANTSVSISQPTAITLSTSSTPSGCNLTTGSATVVAAGGTSPYQYAWSNGQSGSTANNIAAGSYPVTITDANGCTAFTNAAVSNVGGPTLVVTSANPTSCYGGANGNGAVNATSGTAPFTYQWSPSGGNNASVSNLAAGTYTVSVRDANNCITTIPVIIAQPTILNGSLFSSSARCYNGASGTAIVSATGGTSPYTYQWSNGSSAATAQNLIAGNYSVVISDANNCTFTSNISVSQPTTISIAILTNPVSCNGGSDGGLSATGSGGTGNYTFSWSTGGNLPSVQSVPAGNYSVTLTDANGCTSSQSAAIQQPIGLNLVTSSTATLCFGSADGSASVVASGGVGPYRYQWNPTGQSGTNATGLTAGNYSVIITDNNGCTTLAPVAVASATAIVPSTVVNNISCFNGSNGSLTVTGTGGTPPYQYRWNNNATSPSINGLLAGSYSVNVTDMHSCSASIASTITEPTQVNASVNPVPVCCIGQSFSLNANASDGTPPYSYAWSNGANTAQQTIQLSVNTNFNVIVTDANGCVSPPASVAVVLHPPLLVLATMPDTICQGEFASIGANASGGNGGPYTYSWSHGAIGSSVSVSPPTTTNYIVTVADNCGTPTVNSQVYVTVLPVPQLNITNSNMEGCVPLRVHFQPIGTLTGAMYSWTFGDGTYSTDAAPYHDYLTPGLYSIMLKVETNDGCTANTSIPSGVKAYPLPVASFTLNPEETSIYTPFITFRDESTNAALWHWDFGDGSGTSLLKNPTYTYRDTGAFDIMLIAFTNKGCPDTAYGKVRINGEFAIFIPNAFTPNDDLVNDFFKPLGRGIRGAEMWIYDRWGIQIYHTEDLAKGWDGRIGGDTPCQNDVYVYKINLTDLNDKAHRYIGHVTLVR